MSPAALLRWMARESRGARGRMLFFTACLAVGVAAVTGTAGLSEAVENGVRAKSREILGADFTVDGRRPLPEGLDRVLAGVEGLERTDLVETATMVAAPGPDGEAARSRLAQLRAVEGRFPLHGRVETSPAGDLSDLLRPDTVVAARELLDGLQVGVGDEILLGGARYRVAAAVADEPARIGFSAILGPRVYLSREGLERTRLLGFGNRVKYAAYFALPGNPSRATLDGIRERLERELPGAEFLDVDTHFDAQPQGRRSMDRMEGFTGLVALLSLVLGGIGVAQIVRAWLAGRTAAVAVLRCLGLRPAEILVLFLGHTALLALAGSLLGAAVGALLPRVVPLWAPDVFPPELLLGFPWRAALRGVALGVGVAVLFSLPPLTAVWRVPPARVLRADAEPLPPNRIAARLAAAALLAGVLGAAWVQAGELSHAAWFTAGLALLVATLAAGARGLMRLAGRIPRGRLNPYLLHGVAALARPGAGTTGAVVALGLGTMVVTGMWLVETRLLEGLRAQVPADAPTVFLVDIQPGQWEGVRRELETAGARGIDHVPVVMARIASVDGKPVEELAEEARGEEGRSRWALTREQRLTWRRELTPDNEIVEGALWSDPDRAEVSLEARFAERLGVGLGSTLGFDVQGVPVETRVTSLRTVEWESFSINFFVVVEPGVLDRAPSFLLANARVPEEGEQGLQDRLAAGFPNVTVLRVRPIVERVLELVLRLAFGIRVLGSFTVLAGIAILAGAVSASALRRGREAALLKTLGVTRKGVAALLATEYGLCGVVAGAVGAAGAFLLSWAFLEQVADLSVSLPAAALPLAAAGCGVLTAVCGVAASVHALRVRPVEALR